MGNNEIKVVYEDCSSSAAKLRQSGKNFQDAVYVALSKVRDLVQSSDFKTDSSGPKFLADFESFAQQAMQCGASMIGLADFVENVYVAYRDTDQQFKE